MSNFKGTKTELINYLIARTPLVIIDTNERERVERLLAEAAPEEGTALRVRLMGQVGAECHIEEGALERLGEGLALFEIRDETVLLFDADYLLKDPGMRGAFYRAMLPRLDSESERERAVAREALRLGFAALSGKEG